VLNAPSGFTLVKERSGGTGAEGTGTGTGVLYVWRSTDLLTGSESGSVTVSGTGVNALDAAMVTVSATDGFEAEDAVSGNDAVHDQNRTVVADDGTLDVAVDDLVLLFFGSDRGVTTAISAYSISQASATFEAAVEDNRQISNTNNDASLYSAHAAVTDGSDDVPTIGFTQAATNCGPGIAVRVREAAGSGVTGSGALTAPTGVVAGSGLVTVAGSGALTGQACVLAGVGHVAVAGSGALAAPAALVGGTGTVVAAVVGIGALVAPPAVLSGAGRLRVDRPDTGVVERPFTGIIVRP
jgi:hypothetical protein